MRVTHTSYSQQWAGLVVLTIPCVLVSMDISVLYFALPMLSEDLAPTAAQTLWIMDIYGFVLAGLLLTMGTLGDRIGRRRLLMIGAAAFGVASAVAAYSSSAETLIAARALLGAAGATLAPSTLALIRAMFTDARRRRTAIGVWAAGFSGGAVIGPVAGGLLLERFWWGSAFLLGVPVMALLLVCAPLLVPECRDPRPGRFDPVSAVLSLAAVLPVIYGVKLLASDDPGWAALPAVPAGLGAGVVFARRQGRLADPMIDLRLFRSRAFSASLVVNSLTMFAMVGLMLFASQFLQLVAGLRPFTAALWMLPAIVATMAGVAAATLLVRAVRPGLVVTWGLLVAAAGLLLTARIEPGSPPALLTVCVGVMAVGIGMVATLATDLILAGAPPERAGAASALSEAGTEFGGALGIAALGTVGAAVYRAEIAALPGLPGAARETLAGAVAAAEQLSEGMRGALLSAASEAFVSGLRVTSITAAVVMALAAVPAALLLRHVRPDGARPR
ncbi:MFS transporter [Nonomuraea sp. SBT364]|uniref:MFS transporter n=1 Tax=Nonomuraea sp. SBT364 TaxID=1580530 RepID=UPI00066CC1AD|nr:MFS transporter [Nonomuraea sp. SBT364]